MPIAQAALVATEEVSGPLTAGTLTTLLVFGPIVFVQGLAAALFRDLSLSVVMSVGASLILALTLMPVMVIGRRRRSEVRGQRSEGSAESPVTSHESREVRRIDVLARAGHWCEGQYERGMKWSLANPVAVFAITLAGVAGTVWITARLPREILPQVDERVVVASST
jgi:HAE1 family hydrophobic/amphiphilic exporter-1